MVYTYTFMRACTVYVCLCVYVCMYVYVCMSPCVDGWIFMIYFKQIFSIITGWLDGWLDGWMDLNIRIFQT